MKFISEKPLNAPKGSSCQIQWRTIRHREAPSAKMAALNELERSADLMQIAEALTERGSVTLSRLVVSDLQATRISAVACRAKHSLKGGQLRVFRD